MTIKTLTDFYFAQYEKIQITGEYNDGIDGKTKIYTKEEFQKTWEGWFNHEVVNVSFQTYYTFKGKMTNECKVPILYFLYK